MARPEVRAELPETVCLMHRWCTYQHILGSSIYFLSIGNANQPLFDWYRSTTRKGFPSEMTGSVLPFSYREHDDGYA